MSERSRRMQGVLGAGALALVLLAGGAGCERTTDRAEIRVPGGDPQRGPELIRAHGCNVCHTIPGVGGPAWVGPPLTSWSKRIYIAGTLPNTPDNLVAWLYDPLAIREGTAMPRVGLTPEEARHIAAYLYTLR